MANAASTVLEFASVTKTYLVRGATRSRGQELRAVDNVSFSIERGETFALVGESGSGKSTAGRLALGMIRPSCGSIRLLSHDIAGGARKVPVHRLGQMIFQDPLGSFDPRMTIVDQIREVIEVQRIAARTASQDIAYEWLDAVGLNQKTIENKFPHQISGGQRQRAAIARALVVRPKLIVCDEALSALDVSIQGQVANLLKDLQAKYGISYLFISHDLRVVRSLCDRIAVMYRGRIVEQGETEYVLSSPSNDYTKRLIEATPGHAKVDRLCC